MASKLALPYAVALARQYGAKIVVGHAISPEPHLTVPLDPLPDDVDTVRQEAQQNLADFARPELLGDTPYEKVLERGDFWNVISSMIRKHEIDLIVAGTRGRQGVRKLVMGSPCRKNLPADRLSCPDHRSQSLSPRGAGLETQADSLPHRRLGGFS